MKNRFRNEVEVELGGTKYLLRPTFDAMVKIEDHFGLSFVEIVTEVIGRGKVRTEGIYAILSASAVQYDEEELKQDIFNAGLTAAANALSEFADAAFNGGEEIKKD